MNPKQRPRGRSNNGGGNNNRSHGGGGGGPRHINVRTQVFDSNGPEGRIRGNAHQVMEKYLAMARDAQSQGDRVAAENFFQHAEHYLRLINAYNQAQMSRRQQMQPQGEQPAEGQPVEAQSAEGHVGENNMSDQGEVPFDPRDQGAMVVESSEIDHSGDDREDDQTEAARA